MDTEPAQRTVCLLNETQRFCEGVPPAFNRALRDPYIQLWWINTTTKNVLTAIDDTVRKGATSKNSMNRHSDFS